MCGIFGMYSLRGEALRHPGLLSEMGNALHHRGPDGRNLFSNERVALGCQRLRVVEHRSGQRNLGRALWTVVMFQYWLDRWLPERAG